MHPLLMCALSVFASDARHCCWSSSSSSWSPTQCGCVWTVLPENYIGKFVFVVVVVFIVNAPKHLFRWLVFVCPPICPFRCFGEKSMFWLQSKVILLVKLPCRRVNFSIKLYPASTRQMLFFLSHFKCLSLSLFSVSVFSSNAWPSQVLSALIDDKWNRR